MRHLNEETAATYDLINNNAVLISKIHQSFEALEEALGMLKLEEPLFLTYIAKKSFAKAAKKSFAKAVCNNIQNTTEEYKIN